MSENQEKGVEYERLVLEKIKYEFDDDFVYEQNYKIKGEISETFREFDIAIFRENEKNPFWIIECKNWNKKNVKALLKEIEQIPTKIKNLSTLPENISFIVTHPPSSGAIKTANNENIVIEIISEKEALERSWFYEANEIYPYDIVFHPKIFQAKKAIEAGNYKMAIDKLEKIAYEEWLNIIEYSFSKYPKTTEKLLKTVAEFHYDDGWRYNAIQKLEKFSLLEEDFKNVLLKKERDLDVREFLLNIYKNSYVK